jgi:hypothetical protein
MACCILTGSVATFWPPGGPGNSTPDYGFGNIVSIFCELEAHEKLSLPTDDRY